MTTMAPAEEEQIELGHVTGVDQSLSLMAMSNETSLDLQTPPDMKEELFTL